MEITLNIDLEAAIAGALAPEKLQPILDKHVTEAITSAISDATRYSSEFSKALKEQLATAMPHGLRISDVAKFQHILNQSLESAVSGANLAAVKEALAKAASTALPDLPERIKLSDLMKDARGGLHVDDGMAFYAHLHESEYRTKYLYLDSDPAPGSRTYGHREDRRYSAKYSLAISEDGHVYSLKLGGMQVMPASLPDVVGSWDGLLMAMYVGRTSLDIDMDDDDLASFSDEQDQY